MSARTWARQRNTLQKYEKEFKQTRKREEKMMLWQNFMGEKKHGVRENNHILRPRDYLENNLSP